MLDPAVMYTAAQQIVAAGPSPYRQTVAMARLAVGTIAQAVSDGKLELHRREQRWLARLSKAIDRLPDDPKELRQQLDPSYQKLYLPEAYGL